MDIVKNQDRQDVVSCVNVKLADSIDFIGSILGSVNRNSIEYRRMERFQDSILSALELGQDLLRDIVQGKA